MKEAMIQPTALYIRGYKPRSFLGKFIARFTFGEYSHVSFVFSFLKGPDVEIHSRAGKGVISGPALVRGAYDLFQVPLEPGQLKRAYERARSITGDYDLKGIFGFMIRKKVHSSAKWFCSEFVAYVLWDIHPLSRRDPYRETPTTVCESLRIEEVE